MVFDIRKQDIKYASRVLSLSKASLILIGDLAGATIASFWPHPYYHVFCEHRRRSFQTTLSRLQKQGLIAKGKEKEKFFILTKEGEKQRNNALQYVAVEKGKNEKWDGKWRVLVFDIPEKEKSYREFLRAELIDYGFIQLQKSVWISPFRVSEELNTTIQDYGIDKWVKLMIADALFDTGDLEKKFDSLRV